MDHPIKPLGGGSIKNRQGEGQSASQNGLARKSAGGGAQVVPPADRLVLYSRARSSWKSVHSSESNELPASREQRDDRKGGKPAGADTVPTVRTACPATKHEKAPEEPARRGTATKARLPFLFAGGAQDVLHLPGLEEPSTLNYVVHISIDYFTSIFMHRYINIHIICIYVYVYMYIYIYIYIYIYMYIYIYIYIYIILEVDVYPNSTTILLDKLKLNINFNSNNYSSMDQHVSTG